MICITAQIAAREKSTGKSLVSLHRFAVFKERKTEPNYTGKNVFKREPNCQVKHQGKATPAQTPYEIPDVLSHSNFPAKRSSDAASIKTTAESTIKTSVKTREAKRFKSVQISLQKGSQSRHTTTRQSRPTIQNQRLQSGQDNLEFSANFCRQKVSKLREEKRIQRKPKSRTHSLEILREFLPAKTVPNDAGKQRCSSLQNPGRQAHPTGRQTRSNFPPKFADRTLEIHPLDLHTRNGSLTSQSPCCQPTAPVIVSSGPWSSLDWHHTL